MFGGFGRSRDAGFTGGPGRGNGMGYGFRGSLSLWPYIGCGRGGLPRCAYAGRYAAVPYASDDQSSAIKNAELDDLRDQAQDLKQKIRALTFKMQESQKE